MAERSGRWPIRPALHGLLQGGHRQSLVIQLQGHTPLLIPGIGQLGIEAAAALLGGEGGGPLALLGQAVAQQVVGVAAAWLDLQRTLQRLERGAVVAQAHKGLARDVQEINLLQRLPLHQRQQRGGPG